MKLLISCCKEYKHLFGKGKSTKKEIFGKIAYTFNKQAPNTLVTGKQCMRNWTKLETKFKEIEDHNSKSGNDKKAIKFHDMMVDCIGEKKNVKPEVIMERMWGVFLTTQLVGMTQNPLENQWLNRELNESAGLIHLQLKC